MPEQVARYEDSPGLFGEDTGAGTSANCKCDWCGKVYDNREVEEGEALSTSDTIGFADFGDLQILDCCFGKLELAILQNMHRIVPWYLRILKNKQQDLNARFSNLKELKEILNQKIEKTSDPEAPQCDKCGHRTQRSGTVYKCSNCGNSMGDT